MNERENEDRMVTALAAHRQALAELNSTLVYLDWVLGEARIAARAKSYEDAGVNPDAARAVAERVEEHESMYRRAKENRDVEQARGGGDRVVPPVL